MSKDVLLEEVSPLSNVQAIVEQDGRTIYFYLWGGPESAFGVRSCWVRNLEAAPASLDVHSMREQGTPPLLPRQNCTHPDGAPMLSAGDLRVVWFEEGDAAALLSRTEVLAVIPSWSGEKGFAGYARDCVGESPVCWELTRDNVLHERIRRAEEFWA